MSHTSEKMLSMFKELQNDLNAEGKNETWRVLKKSLVTMLSAYEVQNKYDELKLKYPNSPQIPFLEASSLTEADIKNFKDSININKQINKQLRNNKKLKALK